MAKQLYGIIGHPVQHSLSPAMQAVAFHACGMDASYELFDILPENLNDFLGALVKKGISGVNVTIPHKINAKVFIEKHGSLDETAKRLGAVNTIKVIDGKLKGYNTDGPGFYRSLVTDLRFEPEGKNVFVLGAGGAASAVVMYLGNGPKKIFIADTDAGKTKALAEHYKKYYDAKKIQIVKGDEIKKFLDESALLVNATPIGMKDGDPSPIDREFLHAGLYIYDLVYNRAYTQLVRDAKEKKARGLTGLGMLLYQGAIAFEIWTDKKAPVSEMKSALKMALKENG